jgi:predicted transcriptional regulator
MARRRSNIEIIAEMLKTGENGAGKTKMMYSVNMSYHQLQRYLAFLLDRGFIDCLVAVNSHFNYQVSAKGLKLLDSINNVLEALEIDDEGVVNHG